MCTTLRMRRLDVSPRRRRQDLAPLLAGASSLTVFFGLSFWLLPLTDLLTACCTDHSLTRAHMQIRRNGKGFPAQPDFISGLCGPPSAAASESATADHHSALGEVDHASSGRLGRLRRSKHRGRKGGEQSGERSSTTRAIITSGDGSSDGLQTGSQAQDVVGGWASTCAWRKRPRWDRNVARGCDEFCSRRFSKLHCCFCKCRRALTRPIGRPSGIQHETARYRSRSVS